LSGADIWALQKGDQKYVESPDMLCWRMLEKISWTDRVRNEELHRVKGQKNILHSIRTKKAISDGHIFRRNCLIKHVIEGNIGVISDGKTRKKL
jgi:hypothetical protein